MSDADVLRVVSEHLRTFQRSVFRLEAQDYYTSDAEDEAMRRWLAGEVLPTRLESNYLRLVRAARTSARSWRRVHAVTGPTPYLRFEMEAYYTANEAAGEEIGILQHPDLASVFGEQPPDFWLFDDELVLRMEYDETGRIATIPIVTDPGAVRRYLPLRDIAVRHSVPVREYRAALRRQVIPAPALLTEAT